MIPKSIGRIEVVSRRMSKPCS